MHAMNVPRSLSASVCALCIYGVIEFNSFILDIVLRSDNKNTHP